MGSISSVRECTEECAHSANFSFGVASLWEVHGFSPIACSHVYKTYIDNPARYIRAIIVHLY